MNEKLNNDFEIRVEW